MANQIIPNTGRDLIVSMNYDPTGLAWVELFDNAPLGWAVDDVDLTHAVPVVVGSLPPAAPDTSPVFSPQWAQFTGGYIVVPDVVRLLPADFFNWLATNGGATRQVRSSMKSTDLNQAYRQWGGGADTSTVVGMEAAGERATVDHEQDFDKSRDNDDHHGRVRGSKQHERHASR